MRCLRPLATLVAVVLLCGCDAEARRFNQGARAYQNESYQDAIDAWKPLAEAGHAEAQFNLGEMYYTGTGLQRDHEKAKSWFLQAADGGNGTACLRLGMMFAAAQGTELDFLEAYKWTLRAEARNVPNAGTVRAELVKRLSAEEIVEGERLAADWNP